MACNVTVTYLIVPAQENATAWQAQAGGELPARYPGRAHIDPQYMVDASRPNAPAEVVELKDMPLSDRASQPGDARRGRGGAALGQDGQLSGSTDRRGLTVVGTRHGRGNLLGLWSFDQHG